MFLVRENSTTYENNGKEIYLYNRESISIQDEGT